MAKSFLLGVEALPGNRVAVDRMEGMEARAASMQPAFAAVAESFHTIELGRFRRQGWAPLAASTADFKAQHGYPSAILERTLALKKSLTQGGAGAVLYSTPSSLFVGTEVPYAKFHQQGTPNMPARPLVVMNPETARLWGMIVAAYLLHGESEALAVSAISEALY